MGAMEVWMWLIMIVIGITELAKVSMLIIDNGNQAGTLENSENRRGSSTVENTVIHHPPIKETGTMVYYANDRHGSGDKEYLFNY